MKATRQSFGEAVTALAAQNSKIVVLDADLSKSTKSEIFKKKFPERFFQMGICEANMVGVAAGLAINGYVPFICSFGCFLTGRYDQIRMSVGYNQANVKIVGTHAGLNIGQDGYSQMALEDIALMRAIPNMIVLQAADDTEAKACVAFAAEHQGPVYLRLSRGNCPNIFGSDYQFELGRPHLLQSGQRLAVLASGVPVGNALEAVKNLNSQGITPALYNVSSLKPLNSAFIKSLDKFERVLTIEDHSTLGGLGGVIAEAITAPEHKLDRIPHLTRHGLKDVFGESGTPEELYQKYQLDVAGLEQVIRNAWL